MTIEIPDELERQIERAAQARGTDARTFVIEAAQRALLGAPLYSAPNGDGNGESAEAKRLAAIARLRGSVSSGSPTVEEFLRERSEEARLEAQREEEAWEAARTKEGDIGSPSGAAS